MPQMSRREMVEQLLKRNEDLHKAFAEAERIEAEVNSLKQALSGERSAPERAPTAMERMYPVKRKVEKMAPGGRERQILAVLRRHGGSMSVYEVAKVIDMDHGYVGQILRKMAANGMGTKHAERNPMVGKGKQGGNWIFELKPEHRFVEESRPEVQRFTSTENEPA